MSVRETDVSCFCRLLLWVTSQSCNEGQIQSLPLPVASLSRDLVMQQQQPGEKEAHC